MTYPGKFGEVCKHKSLMRSCETCEIEAERDRLKAEVEMMSEWAAVNAKDRDRWRAVAEKMAEAMKWIMTANVHIGNDDQGNVFGQPDAVMCRNKAKEAFAAYDAADGWKS